MTYISASLRREVIERAGNCCEYCRVSQADRVMPYEVDPLLLKSMAAHQHRKTFVGVAICVTGIREVTLAQLTGMVPVN